MDLRTFHAANPGITARAMERSGCYDRFAGRVTGARVLDLACGDGALLSRLSGSAIGLDVSPEELAAARARGLANLVEGRAQALPFADASFDAVTCHLAFMLFDDIEQVVAELDRVLAPGGQFFALLGGGPTADGHDAFHEYVSLLPPGRARMGDPRAKSEAGWRALFRGWSEPVFDRWELDLGGSFDDVWSFLGAGYEATPALREQLHARVGDRADCKVVVFCAAIRR